MNLGPLVRGLSQGFAGFRSGQMQREQMDRDEDERQLRNMLAVYGERRQQQQADALSGLREQQTAQYDREAQAAAVKRTVRLKALMAIPGMTPERAESLADDDVAFREAVRPPEAPTPRNIDPLSPAGIKAAIERARGTAKATADFRAPKEADVLDFLQPDAIQKRAATLTQPWMQGGIEVAPGREPSEAAAQARKDIAAKRQAAFEAERDELRALYTAALDRAPDDATKDRATRAYMAAQQQLADKYGIGKP